MANSRKSRSDPGILAMSKALLTDVMGLSPQTVGKVMKVIRSSGQLQDMKQNMRSMNAVAYRRLNHALDIVAKDKQQRSKKGDKSQKGEVEDKKAAHKKAVNESFIKYLLNELQIDSERLRDDPQAKQATIRLTRANDAQAETLEKRMTREKRMEDRKNIQAETDPKKKSQRRQIMQREKQLQGLKDEVNGKDPNATDSGATM